LSVYATFFTVLFYHKQVVIYIVLVVYNSLTYALFYYVKKSRAPARCFSALLIFLPRPAPPPYSSACTQSIILHK